MLYLLLLSIFPTQLETCLVFCLDFEHGLHDGVHVKVRSHLDACFEVSSTCTPSPLPPHPANPWSFHSSFTYSFYNTKSVVLCLGITALVCLSVTIFSFQSKVRAAECRLTALAATHPTRRSSTHTSVSCCRWMSRPARASCSLCAWSCCSAPSPCLSSSPSDT